MFLELANHNEDLKRLLEKGYAITEDHGYLVVRDIPYLDNNRDLKTGAIVMKFVDVDGKKVRPEDHQAFFAGSHPCEMDGTPIKGLGGGATTLALTSSPDVVVQRSFSNKLMTKEGSLRDYRDFFEKLEHYVTMISGPVARTRKPVPACPSATAQAAPEANGTSTITLMTFTTASPAWNTPGSAN